MADTDKLTLAEYWDELNRHDWYHMMSDDMRVYQSGQQAEKRLERLARDSKAHQALKKAFAKHYFSGKGWNTPKFPKPERPDDGVDWIDCPFCENGYSPQAQVYIGQWYGHNDEPFYPSWTGSKPYTPDMEFIQRHAKRTVESIRERTGEKWTPRFEGDEDIEVLIEAQRLCSLYNNAWSHHLSQDDVDVLQKHNALPLAYRNQPAPSPEELNAHYMHDPLSQGSSVMHFCVTERCNRLGVPHTCEHCGGDGDIGVESSDETATV